LGADCIHNQDQGQPDMTSSPAINIRIATDADIGTIQSLYAEAGLDGGKPIPRAQAADIAQRFNRYPSYRLWVAEGPDGIVGTYALLIADNIAHSGRPFAIVEQVAVSTKLRGGGIGKLMMNHAMEEARNTSCYKLVLTSHVGRADAHAFYDKLGFERHGYGFVVELPADPKNGSDDAE
jgi:GNAT superfamily N-acetyltransferase